MEKLLLGLEDKYKAYIRGLEDLKESTKEDFLTVLNEENSHKRQELWDEFKKYKRAEVLELLANPFYIGCGNPQSDILILGRELAFNVDNKETLYDESITETLHWKIIYDHFSKTTKPSLSIKNFFKKDTSTSNAFDPMEINHEEVIEQLGRNPLFRKFRSEERYKKHTENDTWGFYARVVCDITGDSSIEVNELEDYSKSFFSKCFLTEINHVPSKQTKGRGVIDERWEFLKSDFYRKFPKVIVSGGMKILTTDQVEELFDMKNVQQEEVHLGENSKRSIDAVVLKDAKHTVVLCDQLSGSAGWTNEAKDNLSKLLKERMSK